jgi:hypothetical protein
MVEKLMFYPIIGYYLDRKVDVRQMKNKQWVWLLAATIIEILLEATITIHQGVTTGEYIQNYVQLFEYVIAIAVFVIIKYLFECKKISFGECTGAESNMCRGIIDIGNVCLRSNLEKTSLAICA